VDELWIACGTGKIYRYISAHEIAATLDAQKERALRAMSRLDWMLHGISIDRT